MLRKVVRWVGSVIGYGLFTGVVLLSCLWFLFPEKPVRRYLTETLNTLSPEIQWSLGQIVVHPLLGLKVSNIEIIDTHGENSSLLTIETLSIRPLIAEILTQRKPVISYYMEMYDGETHGRAIWVENEMLEWQGQAEQIDLAAIKIIVEQLKRQVKGKMTAKYSGSLSLTDYQPKLQANLIFADGEIPFAQPLLGHSLLPFSQMDMKLELVGDQCILTDGEIVSVLLKGRFEGEVGFAKSLPMSSIEVTGEIDPRPELFGLVKNKVALDAMRSVLSGKALPFTISGELGQPGLDFDEFSMHISALQQELK